MLMIPAIDLKDGKCVRLKQGRMDDDTVFDILDREYVFPLNLRELEKKGLAASPAGTSEQATAESDIANTPATSESTPETED